MPLLTDLTAEVAHVDHLLSTERKKLGRVDASLQRAREAGNAEQARSESSAVSFPTSAP